MKKISYIFLTVVLVLSLASCSSGKKPEQVVESFNETLKLGEFENLNQYMSEELQQRVNFAETLGAETEDPFLAAVKPYFAENAKEITYTINEPVTEDKVTTVAVDFHFVDMSETLGVAVSNVFMQALTLTAEPTDEEITNMFLTAYEEASANTEKTFVDKTVTFEVSDVDGQILITNFSDEIFDVMFSNFYSALGSVAGN